MMGDLSTEPSMEEILSSIKRIIAEEGDAVPSPRLRKTRPIAPPEPVRVPDEVLELNEPAPEAAAPAPSPAAKPAAPILSDRTADATRGSLEALSRLVVKPEVAGSDTLQGLVQDMLRPMLREWLDANLPGLVETMVQREIQRITAQG